MILLCVSASRLLLLGLLCSDPWAVSWGPSAVSCVCVREVGDRAGTRTDENNGTAPASRTDEPGLSEVSLESGRRAVGLKSSADPGLVLRKLRSVNLAPLASLPQPPPQVQSGPAPSAFGVSFHKCAQLKPGSDPPEISFFLLIHNMASASSASGSDLSQVSVRDSVSGIVLVQTEGREVERGFQSFTVDSLQAGSQVVLNYSAQLRNRETSVLELPAFLTFSNASQNDVSMFGPITANLTLRINTTESMSPSPVLLFAGFSGGFLGSLVLVLLGFLLAHRIDPSFAVRLFHRRRNKGRSEAESGDGDGGVEDEAAFENKMVDVMILEEPQNVEQALDNLEMSSLLFASQQLESARLQIHKDLVVALLSRQGRILEVVQGQVMGAEGRLKEQLEGKMAALAVQCNRETREAMEAELHRQREEQQRAELLCQGAEPQEVLNCRLLLEKLHSHRQTWLQRHLLVRHEEASARLQREITEQRRAELLQIFCEELEEATQLGEMDQRTLELLQHRYFSCQNLLEEALDEVVAQQRFVLSERQAHRKFLTRSLQSLHGRVSETFSRSSRALDDCLCHVRRLGRVASEQLQPVCERAQQQGALLRQRLEERLTGEKRSLRAGLFRRRREEISGLLRVHRRQQKALSSSLSLSSSPLSLDEADLLQVFCSWRSLLSSQSSELSDLLKRLDQEALLDITQVTTRLLEGTAAELRDIHTSVSQSLPVLGPPGERPLLLTDHTALTQDQQDHPQQGPSALHAQSTTEQGESALHSLSTTEQGQSALHVPSTTTEQGDSALHALSTTTEQLQGALQRELREQKESREQSRDFFRRLCSCQLSLSEADLLQMKLEFHRCFSGMDRCLVLPPAELRAKLHCALGEWREEQENLIVNAPQSAAVVKGKKKSRSSKLRPDSELQTFQKVLQEKVALFGTLRVQENVLREKVLEQMQSDRRSSLFSQACLLSSRLISGQLEKVNSWNRALQTWKALTSLQSLLIQELAQRDKMAVGLRAHWKGLSAAEQEFHKDLPSLRDSSQTLSDSLLLCDDEPGLFQLLPDCRMERILRGALHKREELLSALTTSLELSSSRTQVSEELKEQLERRRLRQICQQELMFVRELLSLGSPVPPDVLREVLRLLLPSVPEEELLSVMETLCPRQSSAETQETSGSSSLNHGLVLKLREEVLREAAVDAAAGSGQTERLKERRRGLLLKLLPSACAPGSQAPPSETRPRPDSGDSQPGPSTTVRPAPHGPGPGPHGPAPGLSRAAPDDPGPELGLSRAAPSEYLSVSPTWTQGCRGDRDVRLFVFRELQSSVQTAEGSRRRKRNFLNFKKNSVLPTNLDLD